MGQAEDSSFASRFAFRSPLTYFIYIWIVTSSLTTSSLRWRLVIPTSMTARYWLYAYLLSYPVSCLSLQRPFLPFSLRSPCYLSWHICKLRHNKSTRQLMLLQTQRHISLYFCIILPYRSSCCIYHFVGCFCGPLWAHFLLQCNDQFNSAIQLPFLPLSFLAHSSSQPFSPWWLFLDISFSDSSLLFKRMVCQASQHGHAKLSLTS